MKRYHTLDRLSRLPCQPWRATALAPESLLPPAGG